MKKTVRFLGFASLAVLLSSCSLFSTREISVSPTSGAEQQAYFLQVNPDGLSREAYNFLCGNLLMKDLSSAPDEVLRKLDDFFRITRDPDYLLISADVCRYLAGRAEPDEAISFHLSCFHYAKRVKAILDAESGRGRPRKANDYLLSRLTVDYNDACCGIFTYLKRHGLLRRDSIMLQGRNGERFVLEKPEYRLSVPQESISDVSLCASYKVSNLMQISRRPGIGIPLVCRVQQWQSTPTLRVPPGMTIPVTLVVQIVRRPSGAFGLRLTFCDTNLTEEFCDREGKTWNLALDYSTPLACFLNDLVKRNLISVMLKPMATEKSSGLYMTEPYQPGKIPVVFIHGLMSSPETWVQMINALKNDPVIRARYQFWFYYYSSGSPIVFSEWKLRRSLLALEKELCTTPENAETFRKMVLVGHSMGGMIARLLLQQDSRYVMEKLLQASRAEIQAKLKPEERKIVEEFLCLPALPFVRRAVFMAVPHRGARMAQSPLAHLGAFLIELPSLVLSRKTVIARIWEKLHPDQTLEFGYNELYTGIENLDPDSIFVRALQDSPLKKGLVYHSIIGNKGKAGVPGGSDGIVPYGSSHIDGAASEIIVESDHSVHRRPEAIRELLRILHLHVQETEKSTDGKK